jgi:hypothetical protein
VTRALAYPIYLVVPQAAQRLTELLQVLQPTITAANRAGALAVDLYFRSATGMALIAIHCDPALLTSAAYADMNNTAAQAGAAIVDAAQLPDRARRRFHEEYLPLYDVRYADLPNVAAAVQALAERALGEPLSPPKPVEVKFKRGDDWQLARVRSMTRDAISIATCTPPRRGDLVDLEIVAAGHKLEVRSTVVGIAAGDAASALGTSGFGARYLLASEMDRRTLDAILRAVGPDKLRALEPPPRRRAARYPVRWPVQIRSPHGRVSRQALDVSRHGLFVGCEEDEVHAEGAVHMTIPIDDHGTPVLATGRVARAIPDELARRRGISRGVGIEITAISARDEQRFGAFVTRVARRAEREVVVGAVPARVGELTTALAAAGYCASGISDAHTLVHRTASATRLPDLVLIDSSLTREDPRAVQAARRALAVRVVPLMSIDGDSPEATREIVDGMLLAG